MKNQQFRELLIYVYKEASETVSALPYKPKPRPLFELTLSQELLKLLWSKHIEIENLSVNEYDALCYSYGLGWNHEVLQLREE